MTQSISVDNIEYKEGGWTKQPTAVINLNINGRDYIMDLLTYNDNIEAGRDKFVQIDDEIRMVSEEEYEALKGLESRIKKWKSDVVREYKNNQREIINNTMKILDEPVFPKKKRK